MTYIFHWFGFNHVLGYTNLILLRNVIKSCHGELARHSNLLDNVSFELQANTQNKGAHCQCHANWVNTL